MAECGLTPTLGGFWSLKGTISASFWCVCVCVVTKVSVYGFMTPDYMKYSDHYYDQNHHPVVFYVNHDFQMEKALWQRLHQAGLIQLYMRQ